MRVHLRLVYTSLFSGHWVSLYSMRYRKCQQRYLHALSPRTVELISESGSRVNPYGQVSVVGCHCRIEAHVVRW